jgi:putative heme degradation protein
MTKSKIMKIYTTKWDHLTLHTHTKTKKKTCKICGFIGTWMLIQIFQNIVSNTVFIQKWFANMNNSSFLQIQNEFNLHRNRTYWG